MPDFSPGSPSISDSCPVEVIRVKNSPVDNGAKTAAGPHNPDMRPHEIQAVLSAEGIICIRDHPGTARPLSRMAAKGLVKRLFPGIYVAASQAELLWVRCAALARWEPDAVITGTAAARFSHDPDAKVDIIEFHSTRKKWAPTGFRLHRSPVPPEDVAEHKQLRITRVARTIVHLASGDDGAAIDCAFRATRTRLQDLHEALDRGGRRHGNRRRREVVEDSRDQPWSPAERLLHKILRQAGVTGWATNYRVELGNRHAHLDLAFVDLGIMIEVDGRTFHGADAFESDRARQNDLVKAGWVPLRLTWAMLQEPTLVVELVRSLIGLRRRLHRAAGQQLLSFA